jgi:hypothetical protein
VGLILHAGRAAAIAYGGRAEGECARSEPRSPSLARDSPLSSDAINQSSATPSAPSSAACAFALFTPARNSGLRSLLRSRCLRRERWATRAARPPLAAATATTTSFRLRLRRPKEPGDRCVHFVADHFADDGHDVFVSRHMVVLWRRQAPHKRSMASLDRRSRFIVCAV